MSKVRQVVRSFAIVALFVILAAPLGQILSLSPQGGAPAAIRQSAPNNVPLNLNVTLHGRGATFPQPLIANWTTEYHEDYPNTTIYYNNGGAVGSGAGQSALFNKTVDFGASDAPLNSNQRLEAPNVLHIPETIGSVAMSYNLTRAGISGGMNMTGPLIASIYLGTVVYWDDAAIKAINPGIAAKLPHEHITTVHRSDGSGTTFVFTSYLALESNAWKTTVGPGNTAITWPGSANGSPLPYYLTGNGNGGVSNAIATNNDTFGYVELNYALQHHFTYANVLNFAGKYIEPTLQSTAYAVSNSTNIIPQGKADWSKVSLLNATGAQTYPIASFTYLLVYPELNVVPSMDINESAQANALINFLSWAVHKGQTFAPGNYYVPLPANVVAIDDASIASIKFTIISTPLHDDITLTCTNTGWSITSFSAFSGDNVTLHLLSGDGNPHQFFVDFNNNNAIDQNETSTVSPVFSSTTVPVTFSFTPRILNPGSFPGVGGVFSFKDANHPMTAVGSFTLRRQQVAAPFLRPNTFTSTLIPTLDSSRVSIVGSLIADVRTGLSSGNITVVAVSSTSTGNNVPITYVKAYLLSGLAQGETFILNAAVVPYDLGPVVVTGLTPSYTLPWRQLDFDADGKVNIVELATIGGSFGSTVGGIGYNGQADLNADGIVNIFDLVIIASNFGFTPIFH